ncbi:hypothetical protein Q5O24_06550 [Eubacteriaceae bacterium ES3]|nr:hypothetical protein Q5O24_06550 [Eubacteriaceae bacterium ES3]
MILLLVICVQTTVVLADEEIETSNLGVSYRAHMQDIGNVPVPDGSFVTGPVAVGSSGQGLRLEALWIELTGDVPEDGAITYQVHVQNMGWLDPVSNGEFTGSTGENLQIEAIRISLTNLDDYDVYYRGHVQNKGDLPQTDNEWGWVKNGETLGTTGESLRLEALEIKIVKHDSEMREDEEATVILAEGSFGTAGDGEITDLPAGEYIYASGDYWYLDIQNVYTLSYSDLDTPVSYLSSSNSYAEIDSITGLKNGQVYDVYQVVKVDGFQEIEIQFDKNTILDLSEMQTNYLNLIPGDHMKTVYVYTGTFNTSPYTDEPLANQEFCQYYYFVTMHNAGVTVSADNMKNHLKMDFSDYQSSLYKLFFNSQINYANWLN